MLVCMYVYRFRVKEGMGGGGLYFFEDGVDIRVFLGSGAGLCAGCCKVGEDFVVGEDGGLGFEDLHGWCWIFFG